VAPSGKKGRRQEKEIGNYRCFSEITDGVLRVFASAQQEISRGTKCSDRVFESFLAMTVAVGIAVIALPGRVKGVRLGGTAGGAAGTEELEGPRGV